MSDQILYFNGISPKGKYLTPPAPTRQVIQKLLQEGWEKPPAWVLDWARNYAAIEDPRRHPILETKRPWDLAETGWAVVFAPGLDPRVPAALTELLDHRAKEAGKKHKHFFKHCKYKGQSTFRFLKENGGNPGMRANPQHFPYYVLLVGSPEAIPYKFQSELDVNYAVGRLHFDRVEQYAAYARSVVRAEKSSRPRSRDIVFFGTEHENDEATRRTARDLLDKLADSVVEPPMPWKVRKLLGEGARKEQLRQILGGPETPAFLFAACHGLGCDFEEDADLQETCQGALICQDWPGPLDEEGVGEEQWFAASDVPEKASLHGLIAFLYACYGVGTPLRDNFDHPTGTKPKRLAHRPLVSRLPQRLLSHPDNGALAVIGHVDKAWAASFEGSSKGEGLDAFRYGIKRLLQGHTVGWAMEYLNQSFAALSTMKDGLEEDWSSFEDVDLELLAHLWLLRNDARNFVIFGDPAVRIPGAGPPR